MKMAERGGFEPPIGFYPYNSLANCRLQPLGHLSCTILFLRKNIVSGAQMDAARFSITNAAKLIVSKRKTVKRQ